MIMEFHASPSRDVIAWHTKELTVSLMHLSKRMTGQPDAIPRPAAADRHDVSAMPMEEPLRSKVEWSAYLQYIGEGAKHGRDINHWLEAESQAHSGHHYSPEHGYYIKN